MAKAKAPKELKVNLQNGSPATSVAKKERTIQDIQQEFSALCARAGHLQYQVYTFNKDLDLINSQIRDLNFEAAAMKAKQDGEQVEKQKAALTSSKEVTTSSVQATN